MINDNILYSSDSYKLGHFLQLPPNTTSIYSYLESRGGLYPETVFFGLQYLLKKYLTTRITPDMVHEMAGFSKLHGLAFNTSGWLDLATRLEGKIPLRIRAVAEGSVVPTHNILMSVENTDPAMPWATTYFETLLMRIWYPITVATISWHCRKTILSYLEKTSDDPMSEINFKLHCFGSRGVSSQESAEIGGAAHLVNFMGSDTLNGIWAANQYYDCAMAAFSIPAAEHSTITSWGQCHEVDAFRNMLNQFAKPGALVAVVSDSYDLWNAIDNLWGHELKQQVIDSGATLIVRPDSGEPAKIVLESLTRLERAFGSTVNRKGFKVLNHVRVIQGDGINPDTIAEILHDVTHAGFSATNIAFGMGGALLQHCNRDTQKFAYKCSSIIVDGEERDVFKDPVTDPGKRSKAGRLDLIKHSNRYETVRLPHNQNSQLVPVFENGEILQTYTLDQVRERAKMHEAKVLVS